MKTKFLIPVLAAIFAIGVSFTTAEDIVDPSTDYVLINGNFESVEQEVDCQQGNLPCRVQLEQNGPIYQLYNAANSGSAKKGSGRVIELWRE